MIAVVLVGGAGTRLRPLTLDRPKPMLPIGGMPFLRHLLDRLGAAGVDRVIFSCGYLPSAIEAAFGNGLPGGPALEYVVEPEPLGTAGAIRFAALGRVDGPFLALNGDVLADADLGAAMAFHRARGAVGTLTLTGVQDPTRYGLVMTDADGVVSAFVEKPDPSPELGEPPYWINAGAYVLDPAVLDAIEPGRSVSIEREVFPALVGHGLYGWRAEGYWNDIGTPASYLAANMDVLDGTARTVLGGRPGLRAIDATATVDAASVGRPTVVGAGARVEAGARVAYAVLGRDVLVEAGAVVEGAVLDDGAIVRAGAAVRGSVLGRGAEVGPGARVEGGSVIGAGAVVEDGEHLAGARRPDGA